MTAAVVGVGLTAGIAGSHGIQEAIIGGGILEAILGGSDLIRGIRVGRRANFRRAMNHIKNDVEQQYRAWIEQDHHTVASLTGVACRRSRLLITIASATNQVIY